MMTRSKCIECGKPLKVLFDYRYVKERKMEVYAIEDDGKDPRPTGFCVACVQDAVGKDLNLIASKLSNEKVSYVDFGRRDAGRCLSAAGIA
jgi:hypothetical protein